MLLKTLTYKQALRVWSDPVLREHLSEGLEKQEYLVDLGHKKKLVRKRRLARLLKISK